MHASWGISRRQWAALGLLAFDRPAAVGDPLLLFSRWTEAGLTLGVKAIWVAFCRLAAPTWTIFLYSKVNRWHGCVAIYYVLSFL